MKGVGYFAIGQGCKIPAIYLIDIQLPCGCAVRGIASLCLGSSILGGILYRGVGSPHLGTLDNIVCWGIKKY